MRNIEKLPLADLMAEYTRLGGLSEQLYHVISTVAHEPKITVSIDRVAFGGSHIPIPETMKDELVDILRAKRGEYLCERCEVMARIETFLGEKR